MTERHNTTSQRHPHAPGYGERAFASREALELAGITLRRAAWPRTSSGIRYVGPLPGEASAELEVSIVDIHEGTVIGAAILVDGRALLSGTYVVVDWRDVKHEAPEVAIVEAFYDLEFKASAARAREARRLHALGDFVTLAEAA